MTNRLALTGIALAGALALTGCGGTPAAPSKAQDAPASTPAPTATGPAGTATGVTATSVAATPTTAAPATPTDGAACDWLTPAELVAALGTHAPREQGGRLTVRPGDGGDTPAQEGCGVGSQATSRVSAVKSKYPSAEIAAAVYKVCPAVAGQAAPTWYCKARPAGSMWRQAVHVQQGDVVRSVIWVGTGEFANLDLQDALLRLHGQTRWPS